MGQIKSIVLSAEQRKELLNGYYKGKTHQYRQRCRVVLLKSEGKTDSEVGQLLEMSRLSVAKWVNRWQKEGLHGLLTRRGRGRQSILRVEVDEQAVRQAIIKNRQRISLAKADLEQELGKAFSVRTLKRFLKNLVDDTSESESDSKENH